MRANVTTAEDVPRPVQPTHTMNHINKGNTVIPFIEDHDKLLKVCDAAITFFEQNAQAGERFKFTIDRVGKEKFEEVIKEAYANG